MKRRNFLKILPPLGITPVALNGLALRPFANSRMGSILASCEGVSDRCLILVQLKGGNDGLNTIVPLPQYDRYAQIRPTIKLAQNALINLDSTLPAAKQIGIHPAMTGLKSLYDRGYASVVQAVGYNSMNQSHFKGTDIWLSGGDSSAGLNNLTTGWMGRALQAIYPDVYGAPTPEMPDPLGIQIGDPNTSLGFHTETQHQNAINLSGQDPAGFYSLVQTIGGAPIANVPESDHGHELAYIMGVESSMNLYSKRISAVFNAGTNQGAYPNTSFAAQLKTVARMIRGGSKTKIFLCQLGGFDNHNNQVDQADTSNGTHAVLLKTLSDAMKAFFDDLDLMGLGDRAMACTFSEFGRCAAENGTVGTDHGTLSPIMVFGKGIRARVHGDSVNLSDLTSDNQVKNMQYDYRQVFATLLQDWLGANPFVMEEALLGNFQKMFMVEKQFTVSPDCYIGGSRIIEEQFRPQVRLFLSPNPTSTHVEITYEAEIPMNARISIHSLNGSIVHTDAVSMFRGANMFFYDMSGVPAGLYIVRLEDSASGRAEIAKLSVVR
ncbi:MAG: DUF1501 domain-containing protein [Bacteroidetes bacterium]|nr:DUF1501 domain-containing protein [Bacteroidota bacterium]